MTPPPSKGLEHPFETPLPAEGLYPDEEVSEVKDARSAWKKLDKLDRVLNRMVEPISQIPDIRDKVDSIGERVAKVEVRLDTTKEKVADLDQQSRRPHDCFQVENIERIEVGGHSLRKDVEEDTRKIVLLSKDVDELKVERKTAKELRRSNYYFWVAVAVGFLSTVGGAIWYMRGVSAEIQLESQARAAQFDQVKTVLTKVSQQTDPGPVVQQIKQLQTSVDTADREGAQYDALCVGMPAEQKARVRGVLAGKQLPHSCLE